MTSTKEGHNVTQIDFNVYAEAYGRTRSVQPLLLQQLIAALAPGGNDPVLEVGCGTGNYLAAIARETGAVTYGIDPAANMLQRASVEHPGAPLHLMVGAAEQIPFPDASFTALFSVDVLHHVLDRTAYAREAFRVLRPGGRFLTATDSADDIRGRIPLSSHFPETVEPELVRYPPIDGQISDLRLAGFLEITTESIAYEYDLTDLAPFLDRAYSALRIISDEQWLSGLDRLRSDLIGGTVHAVSRYTMIRAIRP